MGEFCRWVAANGMLARQALQNSRLFAMSEKIAALCPMILLAMALLVFFADLTKASSGKERILRDVTTCDDAARTAAYETGVPLDVLQAITRTETGRNSDGVIKPWPWTVNMEGRGVWFDTKGEALMFVYDHFKTGSRSFDLGCFQINYRWHGAQFASIEEMFDPVANARYAALFLKSLYTESGSWKIAVGAFHSRSAVHADRYLVRFGRILDDLEPHTDHRSEVMANAASQERINRFPLLQSGQAIGLGSLVPIQSAGSVPPVIGLISELEN